MASRSSSSSALLLCKRNEEDHVNQALNMPPAQPQSVLPRKRRNPPDPDAEVVALSPTTLMTKNRFVCEVCHKGFPRDQNLQLHKRGHNLPWKLKQTSTKDEMKKKVYLCPEPTCLNHNPSHALGDLTGIKKHYSRKHGEKKYKCQKCAKMYAVESDLKAHSKTCGIKEYQCHCGTLFTRRDIFTTHRAFCEPVAKGVEIIHPPTVSAMGLGSLKSSCNSNHPSQMRATLPQLGSHVPSAQTMTSTSPTITLGVSQLGQTGHNNLMIKPSLDLNCYKPSAGFFVPTSGTIAQFSATPLLQKATSLGSKFSNNSAINFVQGYASSSFSSAAGSTMSENGGLLGSGHFGIIDNNGQENNLNELLNTFSNNGVGSSIFNGYPGATYEQEDNFHGALDHNSRGYDDEWRNFNLEQQLQEQNTGSDMGFQPPNGVTLTRDFLGVGGEMGNISSDEPQSIFGRPSFL